MIAPKAMGSSGIVIAREGSVAVLTIDRPEVLNALDTHARLALVDAFRVVGTDPDVGALVLAGTGDRAFTVGQDLRESGGLGPATGRRWMSTWVELYGSISSCPVPTVAAIEGAAAGAGLQLGLLCDLRVAGAGARMGLREIDVGLPAITGFWLLSAMLGRSRAIELVLSGRLASAQEAHEMGLVHRLVPVGQARDEAVAFAARLADLPRAVIRATRRSLFEMTRPGLSEASEAATRYQVAALESGVPQALMARFLERRRGTGESDSKGGVVVGG